MQSGKPVTIIDANNCQHEFIALVREYTDWVKAHGKQAVAVLASQQLDHELENISEKYAGKRGRMFLAMIDGHPVGCVAVAASATDICEIKRLYVKADFRGLGISIKLAQRAIDEARAIGYHCMRLDTFEWMSSAIGLYERLGFERIARYNDNTAEDAVFMELDLRK